MAGYSATPLWKKLGIKPQLVAQLLNAPEQWRIPDMPDEVRWLDPADQTAADLVVAFFWAAADYEAQLPRIAQRIRPAGAVWVAWPRKAAGHVSDLGDNRVRAAALGIGLVDVKVAALDEDWSGLKLVWRVDLREAPAS